VSLAFSPDSAYDLFSAALAGAPCRLSGLGDSSRELPMARWCGDADHSDRAVLAHCVSPTIDLGCGSGRMTERLALDGLSALGVDAAPGAVALARARGVNVICADLFDDLPGEGAWSTALLADGNVGIGGDPVRLLRRVRELLCPHGQVVVDLAPPGTGLAVGRLRLHVGDQISHPFPWAVLGADAVADVAWSSALSVAGLHHTDGRWFAVLAREDVRMPCRS
jgi:SAM-dependent methyltransferase